MAALKAHPPTHHPRTPAPQPLVQTHACANPSPCSRSRGHACACASQRGCAGWLRAGRPWPGRQREEEEGSAAQTARRQQTPANSSGHTMANTGGEPPERPRHAADCIRLQAARSRPGHGTARGRVPRAPPAPPSPLFSIYFGAPFPSPTPRDESGAHRSARELLGFGGGGGWPEMCSFGPSQPPRLGGGGSWGGGAIFSILF